VCCFSAAQNVASGRYCCKSRKSNDTENLAKTDFSATLCSADTMVHGRFCAKQCGPSRRHVRNASAVLENFARHAKKTFSTLSARSRHGASRIRRHRFGGEAFHRLTLSSHNTSSCNRVWATWAINVVRQRMPASVLTAGRAQLAVVGLFGPRRVRPRTVAASPYRPR
jgi:hypothetical protein